MSKYVKYIFAKSCIIRIYFAYILWDIFAEIYSTYIIPRPLKYIFMPKIYICRIYISFSCGKGHYLGQLITCIWCFCEKANTDGADIIQVLCRILRTSKVYISMCRSKCTSSNIPVRLPESRRNDCVKRLCACPPTKPSISRSIPVSKFLYSDCSARSEFWRSFVANQKFRTQNWYSANLCDLCIQLNNVFHLIKVNLVI